MEINITNQSAQKKWSRYKKDFILIAQRAQEVLKLEDEYSMSVIFVDPQEIHQINKDYRLSLIHI